MSVSTDGPLEQTLEDLRQRGWTVAIHNDYRQGGHHQTFWLFTHPNGQWAKGEAETDGAALKQCIDQINRYSMDGIPQPFAVRLRENDAKNGWIELGFGSYEDAEKFWRAVGRALRRG